MAQSDKMLTIDDASFQLGVPVDTIRRWAARGLLRYSRDAHNNRLFSKSEIKRVKTLHDNPKVSGKPRFKVLHSKMTDKTSLELFAGAGGTALGLANAGFKHIMLNEFTHNACETLRHNKPKWNVVEGDVHKLSFDQYRGQVTLLQGGVPCQAFSTAGKMRGFGDTRGTLFFEFARAISECQPEVIMMENVKGLLTHDDGKTIATMLARLIDLGYRVGVKVLRSQFLDVAQKRERLVIIGVRNDLDYPILYPKQDRPLLTLWDAIGDVPKSEGASYSKRKREIMDLVPPGGWWKDLPDDLQREYLGRSYRLSNSSSSNSGMARRLAWNEPSLTVTCSPAQKMTERCHPDETRPLTIREYARIQSFPDGWEFCGSRSSQYKQIGNAVPVNMAYHVGRAIMAMLGVGDANDFVSVEPVTKQVACSSELRKQALMFD